MKALWTQEEAEFHGEMIDFDKVWSWPKPLQKPHPPIILGGETDYTLRRVVEYCDGWFPRPGRGYEIKQQLDRLHHMAEEKGRDPKTLSTSVFRAPPLLTSFGLITTDLGSCRPRTCTYSTSITEFGLMDQL